MTYDREYQWLVNEKTNDKYLHIGLKIRLQDKWNKSNKWLVNRNSKEVHKVHNLIRPVQKIGRSEIRINTLIIYIYIYITALFISKFLFSFHHTHKWYGKFTHKHFLLPFEVWVERERGGNEPSSLEPTPKSGKELHKIPIDPNDSELP